MNMDWWFKFFTIFIIGLSIVVVALFICDIWRLLGYLFFLIRGR